MIGGGFAPPVDNIICSSSFMMSRLASFIVAVYSKVSSCGRRYEWFYCYMFTVIAEDAELPS